ncbi:hypothetical protein E3O55_18995 [Cryobacterium sp. MDB1-18-2]|uniref:putative toxin n=1 Tax=unclassified Cryobacterium TaxID=2649013 RepID=UPI001069034F|nr:MULTISPECIES: putative toxin [unclassified Cryobacterium]TFC22106.1 hypothetical protein E3O55_18995 [Cryobacterium sp. MDB1-18-2]TFC40679.1 hypothetical protein E3O50_12790 [Cryobacterium sp. MDB1-18-1]
MSWSGAGSPWLSFPSRPFFKPLRSHRLTRESRCRPGTRSWVGGRTRIFDGLNCETISEVKNVASQASAQQLKDSLAHTQGNDLRFDLFMRPGTATYLTGPLQDAIRGGQINLRFIP